jgi:hypothetical protein
MPTFDRSRWVPVLGGLLAGTTLLGVTLATPSCSSEEVDCAFDDAQVTGRAVNPEGAAYPPGPYGVTPRLGSAPGQVLPNFTFRGFVDGNLDNGIHTVSMADLHDPEGRRNKVLHLMEAAMWCPVCSGQTSEMAVMEPILRSEGLVVVQAVLDGPSRGVGPDRCDLASWVETRELRFTVVFDVGARRVGPIAELEAVPWNALIDTRTMEVLDVMEGAPNDYEAYVRSALDWVEANPASR